MLKKRISKLLKGVKKMEIINEKQFEDKTKKGVVLVDFFANWCGPCKMQSPILEEVQKELGDSAHIYKIDVDQDEDLAFSFGVMSIPTMILFVDGQQKEKHVGLWQKQDVLDTIKKYVKE